MPLPSAELDVSPEEYGRLACGLLDIPVHGGGGGGGGAGPGPLIQSLHLLFTLFDEFRGNAHFGGGAGGAVPER